jgi:uncharacterized protein YydD (DUF2326 family)
MIHRVYSTLKTFKEIRLTPGLNVILADKSESSTSKHTRNGAGKSSFLEVVHFLTAAECPDDSIFRFPELINHRFGMEFDLGGRSVAVERSGASPQEMIIVAGDTAGWPVLPEVSSKSGEKILSLKEWSRVLGVLIFKLEESKGRGNLPYAPTFRSLFPYFVRRLPGGFTEPHLHFIQSKPALWQVGVSYLLGLDWTIPQEWQVVRDEEEEIKKLRAAVGEGDLAEIVGKKAQLRTEIATAESTTNKFRERLDSFQVLPDFRNYERRASVLTQQMSDLSDANTLDEELLVDLERAVSDEYPPQIADLERAYKEVGIALPNVTLRRFEEVQRFHESVIFNRRSYLASEIESAKRRIETREKQKNLLNIQRLQVMTILKSHGALDQFSSLQADYGRRVADLELLRKRFAAAEKIEEGLAKLKIRRQELLLRLEQDYSEQSATLSRAIVTFEEISAQLYQKPAKFMPTETSNGPLFKVEVEGERSPGIGNMQIFCFDMMLMQMVAARQMGPGFLIHDSHLFDPVDSRQVGTALRLGATLAQEKEFQYYRHFEF